MRNWKRYTEGNRLLLVTKRVFCAARSGGWPAVPPARTASRRKTPPARPPGRHGASAAGSPGAGRLQPTAEGWQYYEQCRPLVHALRHATQQLDASLSAVSGAIRVLAPVNFASGLLTPAWVSFMPSCCVRCCSAARNWPTAACCACCPTGCRSRAMCTRSGPSGAICRRACACCSSICRRLRAIVRCSMTTRMTRMTGVTGRSEHFIVLA